MLLAVYSAELGLPFLFAALEFNAATRAFEFLRRHYGVIQGTAGVVLIAMGVLVVTGELFRLTVEIQQFWNRYDVNFFTKV